MTTAIDADVLLRTPHDIDLDAYRKVTLQGHRVRIADTALDALAARRTELLDHIRSREGLPIYGVNVGAGDGSFTSLDDEERESYLRGLNSATSFGRPLPERVVRGIVLARLSSFLDGSAGVSPQLASHVAAMLDGSLPLVPAEGTRGSGEILPLGHLFAGVPRSLALGPKESMALVNGSPCAAALAADVATWLPATIELATHCLALACDALDASESHFDPALADLWGYEEEGEALAELRRLLADPARPRDPHQARVSARILPRVLAEALRTLRHVRETALIALGHVGDNPALAADEAGVRVLSNGGFHNQRALVAVDNVTRAMADLTQIAQHLGHALYQSETAMPDQDNLSLGTTYMVAADWSEEARLLATPSVLSFAAVGQNDVPFPMFPAWRASSRVQECLVAQSAIIATLASQSLFMTERRTTPALQWLLDAVRDECPPLRTRRDVGTDLARVSTRFMAMIERASVEGAPIA